MKKHVVDIFIEKGDIDSCFDFLCSKKEDSLDDIRKRFYYMLSYINAYFCAIRGHYSDYMYNVDCKDEISSFTKLWKVVCDSYLAILLYKSNNNIYQPFITGVCAYNHRREFPSFIKLLEENSIEQILEECRYFEDLIYINQSGFWGVADYTTSLVSIMFIEKEILKNDEVVKVLKPKTRPMYGEIECNL